MKKNILIIGAGGVGSVTAHKCAQNNDILGDICITDNYAISGAADKCHNIIKAIYRKNNLKNQSKKLYSTSVNAMDVDATAKLIRDINAQIIINTASPYCNMHIMDACLKAGSVYIDTAVHEEPDDFNKNYPWYANYEWTKKELFRKKKLTAVLSVGLDPGVVNAYCSYALKHFMDKIDSIDIFDVDAGDHGKYFATSFDPFVNLHEILEDIGYWEHRTWKKCPPLSISQKYNLPIIGEHKLYLMGHDEVHSLSVNLDVDTVRFWMGFDDHFINCFTVLQNIGLLNCEPINISEEMSVVPLQVVKACLPKPESLAPDYKGKTCTGVLLKGKQGDAEKEKFIYNICDHESCYNEVESQAISYTAGLPPVAAAILVANGQWDVKHMVNVEELDPDPFINLLNQMGLTTNVK